MLWSGWRHSHYNYLVMKDISSERLAKWDSKLATYIDGLHSSPLYVGTLVDDCLGKTNPLRFAIALKFGNKGLTNSSSGVISGRTNYKNTKMVFYYPTAKQGKVILGSGEERDYLRSVQKNENDFYALTSRLLPSGHKILYNYNYQKKIVDALSL